MILRNRGRHAGTNGISNGERRLASEIFRKVKDRCGSGRERSIGDVRTHNNEENNKGVLRVFIGLRDDYRMPKYSEQSDRFAALL